MEGGGGGGGRSLYAPSLPRSPAVNISNNIQRGEEERGRGRREERQRMGYSWTPQPGNMPARSRIQQSPKKFLFWGYSAFCFGEFLGPILQRVSTRPFFGWVEGMEREKGKRERNNGGERGGREGRSMNTHSLCRGKKRKEITLKCN